MAAPDDIVAPTLAYIRSVSERYRTEAQILVLNKTIDRLDIEKDAKAGVAVETRAPYTTAMNQLFPGISATNPLVQLGRIEHDIFNAGVLGPVGKQHSWLKKPGKGYTSSFMPEHVTNTYHDSGYNPKEIITNYTAWITPGSYIDPAGRDKPNMPGTAKFPADDQPITIPLDSFGFPGIIFNATMLPNNECRVIIRIPNAGDVDITRTVNFISMGGTDYFCGNPEKNTAINAQENDDLGIAEIKKYVISKELSDFSQILFAIINMFRMRNEHQLYTHCMFTTDNVVAARSKLMGLQSCVQDHAITEDKSVHRVILHLAQMDPAAAARELRTTYFNACIKNNNTVKAHIARAIIQGFYITVDDSIIPVEGSDLKNYLLDILAAIDIVTGLATALPLDGPEDTDVYKKEILKYYAKTPINEKGRVVQSLQRLCVNSPELTAIDPIYTIRPPLIRRVPFGVVIATLNALQRGGARRKTRKFLNLRKMKGGARVINPDRAFSNEELNDLFAAETEPWNSETVDIERESLLHNMRIIINPGSLQDFEDFIFRAFNHLLYICETPLDDRLLSIYRDIGVIEDLSLEEFYAKYINPDIRNPAFRAEARGRLVAARAEDPMEMLADTILMPTAQQIDDGIEVLRLGGELAPGVEAPGVGPVEEMETDDEGSVQKAKRRPRPNGLNRRELTGLIELKRSKGLPIIKELKELKRLSYLEKSKPLLKPPFRKTHPLAFTRKQRKSRRNTTLKRK